MSIPSSWALPLSLALGLRTNEMGDEAKVVLGGTVNEEVGLILRNYHISESARDLARRGDR